MYSRGGGQLEPVEDFSQVDEGLASGPGSVVPEEVLAQVLLFARALQRERHRLETGRGVSGVDTWRVREFGTQRANSEKQLALTYLVNGVADGQHVGAKPLELPSVRVRATSSVRSSCPSSFLVRDQVVSSL